MTEHGPSNRRQRQRHVPIDGERVRRLRIEAGYNQLQLAEMAGITGVHLSGIECGRSGPSPATAKRIAESLGVTIRDLLLAEPVKTGPPA